LTAYHDTNLDPSMRPEKYESNNNNNNNKPVNTTTSAWGKNSNGIPSAWGQQPQQQPQPQKPGKYYNKQSILYCLYIYTNSYVK
jgi:hypothetical protein